MHIIDGKVLAEQIRADVKTDVSAFGRTPRLNVLLVGDDKASKIYVDLKQKAGAEVGIDVFVDQKDSNVSSTELEALIDVWNADSSVDAILIQLPLPYGFDADKLTSRIAPNKDADGFNPSAIVSPLHEGILRLIAATPTKLPGTQTVIIANSDIFAKPLAKLLTVAGSSVDIMAPDDLNKTLLLEADIVVIAIGRANYLHASMVKDGAVIIDVGTNREQGKTVGDVETVSFGGTDCWITPVPGGVGPMTVALLLKNVLKLSQHS